jgi:hypothetical protein
MRIRSRRRKVRSLSAGKALGLLSREKVHSGLPASGSYWRCPPSNMSTGYASGGSMATIRRMVPDGLRKDAAVLRESTQLRVVHRVGELPELPSVDTEHVEYDLCVVEDPHDALIEESDLRAIRTIGEAVE